MGATISVMAVTATTAVQVEEVLNLTRSVTITVSTAAATAATIVQFVSCFSMIYPVFYIDLCVLLSFSYFKAYISEPYVRLISLH